MIIKREKDQREKTQSHSYPGKAEISSRPFMLEKLNAKSRKIKETSRKEGILKIYLLTDSSCVRIKFTGRAYMLAPLTFKYLMKFRKVNVNGETYL